MTAPQARRSVLNPPAGELPELPDREGYELVDGKWLKVPMGAGSIYVAGRLVARLNEHVKLHRLGLALPGECGLQIFPGHPDKFRKPDALFLSDDGTSGLVTGDGILGGEDVIPGFQRPAAELFQKP